MRIWIFLRIIILGLILVLSGCTQPRPDNINNLCSVFKQYPDWYWDAQKVEKKWRVPIAVQMAFIYQESRFSAKAKPPRTKLLWIIPWKRPSSSYGYTQALKSTWKEYQESAGSLFSNRDSFADAVDFIGWYADVVHKKLGIAKNDAYKLYLAYHEGPGGYQRKTYLKKDWLIKVARKVKYQSYLYQQQLASCQSKLQRKPWYRLW